MKKLQSSRIWCKRVAAKVGRTSPAVGAGRSAPSQLRQVKWSTDSCTHFRFHLLFQGTRLGRRYTELASWYRTATRRGRLDDSALADGLPPSVRFWLKRVRKAVERRWSDASAGSATLGDGPWAWDRSRHDDAHSAWVASVLPGARPTNRTSNRATCRAPHFTALAGQPGKRSPLAPGPRRRRRAQFPSHCTFMAWMVSGDRAGSPGLVCPFARFSGIAVVPSTGEKDPYHFILSTGGPIKL